MPSGKQMCMFMAEEIKREELPTEEDRGEPFTGKEGSRKLKNSCSSSKVAKEWCHIPLNLNIESFTWLTDDVELCPSILRSGCQLTKIKGCQMSQKIITFAHGFYKAFIVGKFERLGKIYANHFFHQLNGEAEEAEE